MVRKKSFKQNLQIIILLIILVVINLYLFNYPKPPYFINMQKDAYHFNTRYLKNFSFGQQRLIVAILWVETLMNLDTSHYKKRDLNSWPYLRFSLIANLDKKFYENYLYGAQYLSVIKDDIIGAQNLYHRGLKIYPTDYFLNFAAGYHYFIELKNYSQAIKHFKQALKSPLAPSYLHSLIARLNYEQGKLEAAYNILFTAYKQAPTEALKKSYFEKLYTAKAEIDLNCLNNHRNNCSTSDLYGDPYIKKGGKYQAKHQLTSLKLFKKITN